MVTRIISVGKLKEPFYQAAADEFAKRLSRYSTLEVIEVRDEKAPENLSRLQREAIKEAEGARILNKTSAADFVVAAAIEGERLTSEQLSARIQCWMTGGRSRICFVIGGSLGLSKSVMQRADCAVSFSSMTFPHQLFRLMLMEQIYRAFKIMNNEPYHK